MKDKFLVRLFQLLVVGFLVFSSSIPCLWAKSTDKPKEFYTVVSRNWTIERPKVFFELFGWQCFKGPFKLIVRDDDKNLKWNFRTSDFKKVMTAIYQEKARAKAYHRLVSLSEKSGEIGLKATFWMTPKPTIVDIEAISEDTRLPSTTEIVKYVDTVDGYQKTSDIKEFLASDQETKISNQNFFVSADSFCTETDVYQWFVNNSLICLGIMIFLLFLLGVTIKKYYQRYKVN